MKLFVLLYQTMKFPPFVLQMLIPPNQTRSPSLRTFHSSMTCSPNHPQVTPSLMSKHKNACNNSAISPAHFINGSRNKSSSCKYVQAAYGSHEMMRSSILRAAACFSIFLPENSDIEIWFFLGPILKIKKKNQN